MSNTPLPCPQPDCHGHIRGYCNPDEGGPAVTVSVAIIGTGDYEEWTGGKGIVGDDWTVETVDLDDEWSISALRCDTCECEYTSEQLATLYPDRYTPTTEDDDATL